MALRENLFISNSNMKFCNSSFKFGLGIASGIILVLIYQLMCIYIIEKKNIVPKIEVSDYATIARLIDNDPSQAEVIIIGNSRVDRLVASPKVAVYGVPGSSFLDGLSLIDLDKVPKGCVFCLDASGLFHPTQHEVLDSTQAPYLQLTKNIRPLKLTSRPVSLAMTLVYGLAFSVPKVPLADNYASDTTLELYDRKPASVPVNEYHRAEVDAISDLKARGFKVCLLFLPDKSEATGRYVDIYPMAQQLAAETGIPILSMQSRRIIDQVIFTDTHHLKKECVETYKIRNTIQKIATSFTPTKASGDICTRE